MAQELIVEFILNVKIMLEYDLGDTQGQHLFLY